MLLYQGSPEEIFLFTVDEYTLPNKLAWSSKHTIFVLLANLFHCQPLLCRKTDVWEVSSGNDNVLSFWSLEARSFELFGLDCGSSLWLLLFSLFLKRLESSLLLQDKLAIHDGLHQSILLHWPIPGRPPEIVYFPSLCIWFHHKVFWVEIVEQLHLSIISVIVLLLATFLTLWILLDLHLFILLICFLGLHSLISIWCFGSRTLLTLSAALQLLWLKLSTLQRWTLF